jgi:hypothetical protein
MRLLAVSFGNRFKAGCSPMALEIEIGIANCAHMGQTI